MNRESKKKDFYYWWQKRDLSWFDCRFERFFFLLWEFYLSFFRAFFGDFIDFLLLDFLWFNQMCDLRKNYNLWGTFLDFYWLELFRIFTGNWVNFVDKESENIVKRMLREGAVMGWPVVSVTSLMGEKRDLGENWEPKEQNLIADCPFFFDIVFEHPHIQSSTHKFFDTTWFRLSFKFIKLQSSFCVYSFIIRERKRLKECRRSGPNGAHPFTYKFMQDFVK